MGTPSPTPDTRLRSGFRDRDGRLRRLLATAAAWLAWSACPRLPVADPDSRLPFPDSPSIYFPLPPVVIDNPILNGPFTEPTRHFRFSDDGITDEVVSGRRESGYFLPIAAPRKKSGQLKFDTEWTEDRFLSSPRINRIRERVRQWREGGYVGITRTTARLLEYWTNPERERKLFFCQQEALETAIYLTEVAGSFGDAWIENELREENATFNEGLPRVALKMATGSGKTVVMAMLIAWHALNKLEERHDKRFSDAFLIVSPGITIRDRLRVLLPQDPSNYYRDATSSLRTWWSVSARRTSSSPTTTRSCCTSAAIPRSSRRPF